MKSIAVLSMIVVLSSAAVAQSTAARNSLYAEGAGNGMIYSANYDRLLTESFGARVGVSYTAPEEVSIVTFPLMAYYLIGSGSSKLELGLGACVILQPERQSVSFAGSTEDDIKGNGVLGTATVGYRYQRAEGGFVFRAGLTPFFGKFVHDISRGGYEDVTENVFRFKIWGGISVGYAF
jgi:hypothetical protein